MRLIYNLLMQMAWWGMRLAAVFNSKLQKGVAGRSVPPAKRLAGLDPKKNLIWMHAASLGEYEQGLPILEQLKSEYPSYQILITFFSPSGYDVKKNTPIATVVTYLPWDTRKQVADFLKVIKPQIVLMVKYEIWPTLFHQLHQSSIPIYLISAHFHKGQAYFKWYGGLLRTALRQVEYFFVQEASNIDLLKSIGIENAIHSGDTRYDRVAAVADSMAELNFVSQFKGAKKLLVVGSSWEEDEAIILPFIHSQMSEEVKIIIAPHKVDDKTVASLMNRLKVSCCTYKAVGREDVSGYKVMVLNTIGLLSKAYRYAEFAYVGGAFRTGLHNTLEAAIYGIPVIIGPEYEKFPEAKELIHKGGMVSISTKEEFQYHILHWLNHPMEAKSLGERNKQIIENNKGATKTIFNYLSKKVLHSPS